MLGLGEYQFSLRWKRDSLSASRKIAKCRIAAVSLNKEVIQSAHSQGETGYRRGIELVDVAKAKVWTLCLALTYSIKSQSFVHQLQWFSNP